MFSQKDYFEVSENYTLFLGKKEKKSWHELSIKQQKKRKRKKGKSTTRYGCCKNISCGPICRPFFKPSLLLLRSKSSKNACPPPGMPPISFLTREKKGKKFRLKKGNSAKKKAREQCVKWTIRIESLFFMFF